MFTTHRLLIFILATSVLALGACGDDDDGSPPPSGEIAFDTTTTTEIEALGSVDYVVTGLTDGQAYRITLVVDGNVTVSDGAGTFVDADGNGAADAGASEEIALITSVNGATVADGGAKTVPDGTDDPANPSGIFPANGTIVLTVTGVGDGTVYPVLYENGGESTFLEIGDDGVPIETHVVGGAVDVAVGTPVAMPPGTSAIEVDGTVDYTVTGLNDAQAYRITLVVDDNVTVSDGAGVFVDNDDNGAADAGASEETALITTVNGSVVADGGAKTVPAGTDDPADPSGIFPTNGTITLTVTGVGAGTVYPVIYENGGESTFLEIGDDGVPIETHVVAGATMVTSVPPQVEPDDTSVTDVGGTVDYTVTGLNDAQAYRITLVVDDNVTVSDGAGVFVDNDDNGAADAGASEDTALITTVNGSSVADGGAKTVPAGTDDPADPTGIFPTNGTITLTVTGVGAGTVYPVIYENGGESTFLEIGDDGVPIETHLVAGATMVNAGIPMAVPSDTSTIDAGDTVEYAVSGLEDSQAYRITLVVDGNVSVTDGAGVFVDGDDNGAADAGASEETALITIVNGSAVADGGAKTVPAGTDDPADPTGIFPTNGTITLTVTGVGAGTVYPVIYENGGDSTFLEIDDGGTPVETHLVAGAIEVLPSVPQITPDDTSSIDVGGTVDYTVTGLDDAQAYRITLVVDGNVSVLDGAGMFVDGDANGAADAGPSEDVALITMVNGTVVDGGGAKTVPGGADDPADPSGIFPTDGTITLTVTGVGSGTVYPVVYENGGESTFLEIDLTGTPAETHAVGGAIAVTAGPPEVTPDGPSTVGVDGTVDYTVTGLEDSQAYRITLVVDGNVTVVDGAGVFVDGDLNGAADAGASEAIALITSVNGFPVVDGGAKTVPAGTDDPADPSGMFPSGGMLTLTVTGVGTGTVYPVIYENGGASTFLEIDLTGMPIEPHLVAGATTVE